MLRCKLCNGFKQIYPLGGIAKACPACQGIGYVDREVIKPTIKEKNEIIKLSVKDRMAKARAARKFSQAIDSM